MVFCCAPKRETRPSVAVVNGPLCLVRGVGGKEPPPKSLEFQDTSPYLPGSSVPRDPQVLRESASATRLREALHSAVKAAGSGSEKVVLRAYDTEHDLLGGCDFGEKGNVQVDKEDFVTQGYNDPKEVSVEALFGWGFKIDQSGILPQGSPQKYCTNKDGERVGVGLVAEDHSKCTYTACVAKEGAQEGHLATNPLENQSACLEGGAGNRRVCWLQLRDTEEDGGAFQVDSRVEKGKGGIMFARASIPKSKLAKAKQLRLFVIWEGSHEYGQGESMEGFVSLGGCTLPPLAEPQPPRRVARKWRDTGLYYDSFLFPSPVYPIWEPVKLKPSFKYLIDLTRPLDSEAYDTKEQAQKVARWINLNGRPKVWFRGQWGGLAVYQDEDGKYRVYAGPRELRGKYLFSHKHNTDDTTIYMRKQPDPKIALEAGSTKLFIDMGGQEAVVKGDIALKLSPEGDGAPPQSFQSTISHLMVPEGSSTICSLE